MNKWIYFTIRVLVCAVLLYIVERYITTNFIAKIAICVIVLVIWDIIKNKIINKK